MPSILLGSASPRRRELLTRFRVPFQSVPSKFDEDSIPFEGDPERYVIQIAEGKAQSLQAQFSQSLILTSDTTVYHKGQVLGKPQSPEEATEFLTRLSGSWHSVFTGVTLLQKGQFFSRAEETRVLFAPLSPQKIQRYQELNDCMDKAGAYGIQGAGALVVERIEGCYFNVMGLPLQTVEHLFNQIGKSLWDAEGF